MQMSDLHDFSIHIFNLFFRDSDFKQKKENFFSFEKLSVVARVIDCLHSKKPDEKFSNV